MLLAIDKLKGAVADSKAPLLDAPVYSDSLRTDYLCEQAQTPGFMDVPISSIVALNRLVAPCGATWRENLDLIKGKAHWGEPWSDDIFSYFEGELKDQKFDQPGSSGNLQMIIQGGAAEVGNGAHRTIAAVCWLAARGVSALRSVRVSYISSLRSDYASLLNEAVINRHEVQISRHPVDRQPSLAIAHAKGCSVYTKTDNELRELKVRSLDELPSYDWAQLPDRVMRNLVDNWWQT